MAIENLKHRSAGVRRIDKLKEHKREYQLLILLVVFHIGIYDAKKKGLSKVIEMQSITAKRLNITEEENSTHIDKMIYEDFNEFSIRIEDFRYIHYIDDSEELYDHSMDPEE